MTRDPLAYLGVDSENNPQTIVATRDPAATDIYDTGTVWVNKTDNEFFVTTSSGHWEVGGSGTAAVATLTGDTGGAISPVSGDIIIAGGTNCASSGSGHTITLDVPDASSTTKGAIEIATNAETLTGTSTTLAVTPDDLNYKLGSQTAYGVLVGAGTAAAVVATTAGTNGQVLIAGTTANPAFASITHTGGTLTSTPGASTLNIDVAQATESQIGGGRIATAAETVAGLLDTVFITPAKAALLPVGVDATEVNKGVARVATQAETLAYTIDTDMVTPLKLGQAFAAPPAIGTATPAAGTFTSLTDSGVTSLQGGEVNIATDSAANAVNIGLGATARAIAIGSSAAAHTITIGNTTGAASLNLACGTGNFALDGAATSNYTVGTSAVGGTITIGGTAQTGTITLGSSSGANAVAIGAGAGATTVNVANGIGGNTISIGTGANGAAQTINLATGASAANSNVNILTGNGTAGTQTLSALTGTRAGVCNIGTGAAAHVVTIGSTTAAAATTLQSGTGNTAITSAGTVTLDAAGVLELNSSAGVIGIGNDAVAQNINVGTGGAARTITIGNVTGATTVNVNTGTGGFGVQTTGAGDITLNSADTVLIDAAGVLELNSSAGVISIGNDAIAQNIDIGTGGAARTITLGNVTGATAVNVNTGTGGMLITTTGAGDFAVNSADTLLLDAAGVLELNSSAGIISIGNDAIAQNINVGTGGAARTITIGNNTGATAVNFTSGTGGFSFTPTGAGVTTFNVSAGGYQVVGAGNSIGIGNDGAANAITIGNNTGATQVQITSGTGSIALASTGTGDITINSSDTLLLDSAGVLELNSSAGIISIGNDNVAQNINIGTGAAARVVTIGNVTDATQVVLNSGTAGIQLASTGAGDITINSSDTVLIDSAGVLELNSSAGIIGIGNDAVAQNINIGTGAAARTITVGNNTGTTAINLTSGTGNIALSTAGTGDITLDSDDTILIDGDGVIEINSSAGEISIGNDADAQNINIGTGAAARTLNIGNNTANTRVRTLANSCEVDVGGAANMVTINGASGVQLNSTAGALGFGNDADAQPIYIGTGGAARTITIGNSTGATSVIIDNGTGALDIGITATDHNTTLGSTTGVSLTTVQSGTGGLVLTGTIAEATCKIVTRSADKITITQSPVLQSNANTGAVPSGSTGDVNLMMMQEGIIMEEFILGAGQTIIAPRMDANGLLISLDLTNTEGAEYNFGAARSNSRHAYTIGTSPAFYIKAAIRVADVSGVDPLLLGFRKSAANNATFTNYTDFASIGLDVGVNDGTCIIQTNLNNAGVAATNTTDAWADAATKTLAVYVSAAGVVTYTINGVAPTATAAFTFDNGDVVVPFLHFLHAAAAPGEIHLVSLEIGPQ